MAVVWMCGFESGLPRSAYTASGWAGSMLQIYPDSSVTMQPASGHGGGRYSLSSSAYQDNYWGVDGTQSTGWPAGYNEFVFHFAYYAPGQYGSYGAQRLFSCYPVGGAEVVQLQWTSDTSTSSTLSFYVNGSLEATSTSTFAVGSWRRFVLAAKGSTGDYTVYVDGVAAITVVGGTTFATAPDSFYISPCGRNGGANYMDHLVLASSVSSDLALLLGDIYIQGLRPNGDDTDGSWVRSDNGTQTDIYQMIDDNGTSDYIETTTDPDTFKVAVEDRADINAAWAPAQVHAVQALHFASAAGAVTQAESKIEVAGTTTTGSAVTIGAVSKMVWQLETWTDTAAALDTIKIGLTVD